MLKKVLKGTREFLSDIGEYIRIDYCLTETVISFEIEESITIYGVELCKYVNGKIGESETVGSITDSKNEINFIMDKLIGLCVTPITLVYALDGLIQKYTDNNIGA